LIEALSEAMTQKRFKNRTAKSFHSEAPGLSVAVLVEK